MNTKYILLSLGAVALLAAGCSKAATNGTAKQAPPVQSQTEGKEVGADAGNETAETKAKEKAEYEKNYPNEEAEGKTERGSYKDYSAETVAVEQKAGKKVVLFFHAKWCGECNAIDTDLKAHPEKVPAGVTVLKIDYDTEKDLKNKYGIISQHTFVQIDANGNQIVKWTEETADSIVRKVK